MDQFAPFKHLPNCVALARRFIDLMGWDTFTIYSFREGSFVVEQRTDVGNTFIHVFEHTKWFEIHTPELWSTLYYEDMEDAVSVIQCLEDAAERPSVLPPTPNRDVEL